MNSHGNSLTLYDAGGRISGSASAVGLFIKRALVGSLTISGLVDSTGATPAAWVINAGSNGYQAAPGSASNGGGQLHYTLSNPADSGAAVVCFEPR